jgi:hypothetical protein
MYDLDNQRIRSLIQGRCIDSFLFQSVQASSGGPPSLQIKAASFHAIVDMYSCPLGYDAASQGSQFLIFERHCSFKS